MKKLMVIALAWLFFCSLAMSMAHAENVSSEYKAIFAKDAIIVQKVEVKTNILETIALPLYPEDISLSDKQIIALATGEQKSFKVQEKESLTTISLFPMAQMARRHTKEISLEDGQWKVYPHMSLSEVQFGFLENAMLPICCIMVILFGFIARKETESAIFVVVTYVVLLVVTCFKIEIKDLSLLFLGVLIVSMCMSSVKLSCCGQFDDIVSSGLAGMSVAFSLGVFASNYCFLDLATDEVVWQYRLLMSAVVLTSAAVYYMRWSKKNKQEKLAAAEQ